MKNLNEKKMLVRLAKMLGEPVDPALLESIEKEERLAKSMFKEEQVIEPVIPQPVVIEEVVEFAEPVFVEEKKEEPPEVAETGVSEIRGPDRESLIQQTANSLSNIKIPSEQGEPLSSKMQKSEIDGIRKQIANIISRLGTLSMGGGGTGVVRIFDTDDYAKSSGDDPRKFMTYRNGMFQMDFVNPREIISNTSYSTSDTYYVTDDEYYIGVDYNGKANVFLPTNVETGRIFVVKDESGKCSRPLRFIDVRPTGSDTIEGKNFARLAIDYGSLTLIYRNGWRVI